MILVFAFVSEFYFFCVRPNNSVSIFTFFPINKIAFQEGIGAEEIVGVFPKWTTIEEIVREIHTWTTMDFLDGVVVVEFVGEFSPWSTIYIYFFFLYY